MLFPWDVLGIHTRELSLLMRRDICVWRSLQHREFVSDTCCGISAVSMVSFTSTPSSVTQYEAFRISVLSTLRGSFPCVIKGFHCIVAAHQDDKLPHGDLLGDAADQRVTGVAVLEGCTSGIE